MNPYQIATSPLPPASNCRRMRSVDSRSMSGYSKVTVSKVKKTLKATGVSMRMTPVRLRKLASFMTHFLFIVYLPSARTNLSEHIFRQVKPQKLCYQLNYPLSSVTIAPLPLEGLLVDGVCVHLPPLSHPPVSHIHHLTCATGSPICLTLTIIHTPGTPSLPEPAAPQSREKAL